MLSNLFRMRSKLQCFLNKTNSLEFLSILLSSRSINNSSFLQQILINRIAMIVCLGKQVMQQFSNNMYSNHLGTNSHLIFKHRLMLQLLRIRMILIFEQTNQYSFCFIK